MQALRDEHGNMTLLLNMLDEQIGMFAESQQPNYELIKEIVDYFLTYPDLCHHPKENAILRKLRERDPAAAERIGDLEAAHEEISDRLHRFSRMVVDVLLEAEISRDEFVSTARSFIENERSHMVAEEKHFFTAVENQLSKEDWNELEIRLSTFKDPLLQGEGALRFRELHACLKHEQA